MADSVAQLLVAAGALLACWDACSRGGPVDGEENVEVGEAVDSVADAMDGHAGAQEEGVEDDDGDEDDGDGDDGDDNYGGENDLSCMERAQATLALHSDSE